MKIAASEAQWDTCQPCSFSLFQIGGFTEEDQTPSFSIQIPHALSYMATGSFDGQVQGLNELQTAGAARCTAAATTCRTVRVIYWSMRVMAFAGVLMFLVAARRGVAATGEQKLERARWFLWTASSRSRSCRTSPTTAGWILTEMGRQPWIVQGLLKTADAQLADRLLDDARVQPRPCSSACTWRCSCVDFWLMRRYAKVDPPGARPRRDRRDPDANDRLLRWTCRCSGSALIAFFFGGYFVLEGFDFGVGLLLPILPRNEEERDVMFRTIGPVWDGNEVWLVVAGAAMFAAFPAWYATMFSGFYIALLLLLVFLIVRVLSFEWRERHHDSRWRRPLDTG